MIRINLSPSAKRKASQTRAITAVQMVVPTTKASRGSIYAVVMLLGWIAIGGVVYFLQTGVSEDTQRIAGQTAALVKDAKEISDKIDEEGLQARKNYQEEVSKAVAALETKRRTPIYVYHELTNILTTGKQPTMIELERLKREDLDPQSRLKLDWDAHSVWLKSMTEEENGVLAITGGARDPDDLSEFVKRIRASARFARVTHPKFKLEEVKSPGSTTKKVIKPGESLHNFYSFELTAQVRYWD
ncbi:MAG: PilN domain-containing protein [Enhygromyxa sp.]